MTPTAKGGIAGVVVTLLGALACHSLGLNSGWYFFIPVGLGAAAFLLVRGE